jgi:hypothetical protein
MRLFQIPVEARRVAHRARDRRPQKVGIGQFPPEANARQVIEVAIAAVLHLGAEVQLQGAGQRDGILRERIADLDPAAAGYELRRG